MRKQGLIKEACRLYAEAILGGSVGSMIAKNCKKRFLKIWNEFGPFDYRKDIEAEIEESLKEIEMEGDTPECCGESQLAISVREQDAFLQMIDVLLGKKEHVEHLNEVTLHEKKWTFRSAGPLLKVFPKDVPSDSNKNS